MKLNIAEKIRKMRRERNLTQEQVAYALGVTFKAVSRWETESAYPDIEMLPVIAAYFGITVDELLGVEKSAEERRIKEFWNKYNTINDSPEAFERRYEALDILYEMNRAFPKNDCILFNLCNSLADFPEKLGELREKTTELVNLSGVYPYWRDMAIKNLISNEKEELVSDLLVKYTTDRDMRRDALLEERYEDRKEWDKYEKYKQLQLLTGINMTMTRLGRPYLFDIPTSMRANKRKLEIINMFTDLRNTPYASGDGVPDLWFNNRFLIGVRISCYLASTDRKNEAFEWLEDAVTLMERAMSIPDGSELTYRCAELDRLVTVAKHKKRTFGSIKTPFTGEHDVIYVRDKDMMNVSDEESDDRDELACYFDAEDGLVLFAECGWAWFDPIRSEPRFIACQERIKKLYLNA